MKIIQEIQENRWKLFKEHSNLNIWNQTLCLDQKFDTTVSRQDPGLC